MAQVLHHIHLIARDVAAAARFFVENFGATVRYPQMDYGGTSFVGLWLGPAEIRIRGIRPTDAGEEGGRGAYGLDHFGIQVEDLAAFCEVLRGKGIEFVKAPGPGVMGSQTAFIRGPDGVLIELVQEPPAGVGGAGTTS